MSLVAFPRVQCVCYPDDERVDPSTGASCLSSAEMPYFVLGTESTQLLFVDKDGTTGSTRLFFSNIGGVTLFWSLAVTRNAEAIPWEISSANGTVETGELEQVTLLFNASGFQARALKYVTQFTLNTSSPIPTPHPISAVSTVIVHVIVSATPSAEWSVVTLLRNNDTAMMASKPIRFLVRPVDVTGRAILDASDVAYTAAIESFAANSTAACSVAYDASADVHQGVCQPPTNVAGEFSIKVRNIFDELVGGEAHRFLISTCPESYILDLSENECKCPPGYDAPFASGATCLPCAKGFYSPHAGSQCNECPEHETSDVTRTRCVCEKDFYRDGATKQCFLCPDMVDCAEGSVVSNWTLHPGYWRLDSSSADVRLCRFGERSCPGDEGGDDFTVCSSPTDDQYCGCGYAGPLCATCAPKFFQGWAGGSCVDCGEPKGHRPSIVLASVLATLAIVCASIAAAHQKRIRGGQRFQILQYLSRVGRVKTRVVFFSVQVRLLCICHCSLDGGVYY